MKKQFSFICICLLIASSNLQSQTSQPLLIIRGDDMGSSHSANVASIDTYVNGIEKSIEVMVVTPWFPEAVRMLNENQGVDVGLHLTITSEWENIKWRPLTHCPSLTDRNGYFLPMLSPNPNYKGLAITENEWKLDEIEREFRAQIELALKNIPRISHISGHMGSTSFAPQVSELTRRLAAEYGLADVSTNPIDDYAILGGVYNAWGKPPSEKENAFIEMLTKLEAGKTYLFVEHPSLNNDEMKAVYHIGYENVAEDRQAVTDMFKSQKVKDIIAEKGIRLVSYNDVVNALPRSTAELEKINPKNITNYLNAVKESGQDLHSIMILRHGKVVYENWLGDNASDKNHVMNSVSKTFTATAIGFAVNENRLKVTDKVISFFPDDLPAEISENLKELEIRHLLTMSVGHDSDPTNDIRNAEGDWVKQFLAKPIEHKPGTKFIYNTMATYVLSAIVQKVSGETVLNYLYPRLLRPLGISGAEWENSPTGVNKGGWGLYIKTEDMAKMGQFMLQKGKWEGKQLLPEAWFNEATQAHITQAPQWSAPDTNPKNSDWIQGYGYQIWRCRYNAYRADGANGQFIIIIPEKDAVIVTTANIQDMQGEINLIWKYLLPAMK